jgi:hypothetical protein
VKKYYFSFALFSLLFLFIPQHSHAARSISIESDKSALFGEEEMTIKVASLSGFTNGEILYVKGAFFQDGSTNYFGYSKSTDAWIKNGSSTNTQKQIKIGDWDGKLIVKTDFSDSGYKGEGSYKFKLGFYYGSFSAVNWSSNNLNIDVSEPDPTPTPTLVPTLLRPTDYAGQATPTVKASLIATVTPVKKSLSLTDKKIASLAALKDILGTKSAEKKAKPTPALKKETREVLIKGSTAQNISAIFILAGGLMIMGCGILVFLKNTKD